MIKPGLISITFRHLTPPRILELAREAALSGIEWGGDVHVPHGDLDTARTVQRQTAAAGLEVASYGSYFRLGQSAWEGLAFETVLATARVLEAPLIRVWAGTKGSEQADAEYRAAIAEETRRICDLAARAEVLMAYEFHGGTLTDTAASARALLEDVNHPSLRSLWQPPVGLSQEECLRGLELVKPWLAYLHVFTWRCHKKRPLQEGAAEWQEYLAASRPATDGQYALLEFVRDDDEENFLRDAATLREWLESGERRLEAGVEIPTR